MRPLALSWREFEELVGRARPRPGCEVRVTRDLFAEPADPWATPWLDAGRAVVTLKVLDSTGERQGPQLIGHHHPVPAVALRSRAHAAVWLLELMQAVAAHEAAEQLLIDGRQLFYPHGEGRNYVGHRPLAELERELAGDREGAELLDAVARWHPPAWLPEHPADTLPHPRRPAL